MKRNVKECLGLEQSCNLPGQGHGKATEITGTSARGLRPKGYGARPDFLDTLSGPLLRRAKELEKGG